MVGVIVMFSCHRLVGQAIPHWTKITTPLGNIPVSPFFLNENIGFVVNASTAPPIYRTTDGGSTWKKIFNLPLGLVNQEYYASVRHGFIAATNGLFETQDTGSTWTAIYVNINVASVYSAGNMIFAALNNGTLISKNEGSVRWDTLAMTGKRVIGNKDSLVYAADITGGKLWYSTNLGNSWASNAIFASTLDIFCFPHCNDLLTTNSAPGDVYAIMYSGDYGKSWKTNYKPEIGAYLSGNSCAIYVSYAGQLAGILRSEDRGKTWPLVSGLDFSELDDHDFRNISVLGNGAVIYACQYNGSFWKSTDGGDGTLNSNTFSKQFSLKSNIPTPKPALNTAVCDTPRFMFVTQNLSCNSYHIDSLHIDGLDSNEYQFSLRKHYSCSGLPDTLLLSIFPQNTGTRTVTIDEHFQSDEFMPFDTSFVITLNINASLPPALSLQSHLLDSALRSINFGSRPICLGGGSDTLQLSNISCSGILISSTLLETDSNSSNDFTINAITPYNLNIETSPNRIILQYAPHTPGKKSGKIIIFTSMGNDTIFVAADARADTARLVVERDDTIRFEARPLCIAGGRDTILLTNPSCFKIRVLRIHFVTDSMTNYEFALSASGPNLLQADGQPERIILWFHPFSIGFKTGKLIIETDLRNDTIPVFASVVEDARTLGSNCDFMQSPLCDSVDGFVHLANRSCREMTLHAITIPSPFKLLPVRLPLVIDPGDSAAIPVRFIPSQRGNTVVTGNAKISQLQPLSDVQFDTTLTLIGFAMHGTSSYALSSTTASFDTLHFCDSAKRRIILYSSGCDSLPLSAISIFGDPDFTYAVLSPQPSALAVGDSIVLDVSLNPTSIGNKSATIIIALSDSSKVTVLVTATVVRSLRVLSSNANSIIDFGKQYTCDNGDTTITLYNRGCDTVRLWGTGFQGSGFGISNTFPIIIPPGMNITIDIKTILDTTGGAVSNSAQLTFNSDADISLPPITLTRRYMYPHLVHLRIEADAAPMTSLSVLKITLKAPASEVTDLRTIDLAINYNSDMLGYLPKSSTMQSSDGKSFHLSGSPMISSGTDSSIAIVAFEVFLSKDTATNVTLGNIIFNADPQFTECVAIPMSAGIDLQYTNSCGDPAIRTFIQGQPLKLSIHPNPVHDEIVVDIQTAVQQDEKIEIFDALGVKVFSDMQNVAAGSHSIHLDTKSLSGGMYLLRIGEVSQSFVKVK
jgi:hypothetical protein